jgi:hypothetical protein
MPSAKGKSAGSPKAILWLSVNSSTASSASPRSGLRDITHPRSGQSYLTTEPFGLVEQEIKLLLAEKGVSYVWQLVNVQEDVLGCTPDREPLLEVLKKMLVRLAPTEELTIVDRYLFPTACSHCVNDLVFVLAPIIGAISRVVIVTSQSTTRTRLVRCASDSVGETARLFCESRRNSMTVSGSLIVLAGCL